MLDLEALLHHDEQHGDPRAIATRDAQFWREKIAPALPVEVADDPSAVLRAWLEARRAADSSLMPGTWLVRGWRALGGVALTLGLVLGFVVANGALFYAGQAPVNVLVFLAVTVGVQWLMLLWAAFAWMARGFREASARALVALAEHAGHWLAAALEHLPGEQRARLRGEAAALRHLSGRNSELLRWPPLIALQTFGVAWNAGVLVALLLRALATDVAFAWETVWVSTPAMHTVAHVLATPWCWLVPDACPTLAQVAASQFEHARGVVSLDHAATVAWSKWLVGVIVVYGLLPRAVLLLWFANRQRRALRRVSFDEPRHKAAWHRLTGPVVRAEPSAHDDLAAATPASLARARTSEPGCVLIASTLAAAREPIVNWVSTQLGWRITAVEEVQIDFPSGNADALARLGSAPRWIVAVPAPFTAFSAFAQFLKMLPEKSEGYVLVVGRIPESRNPGIPESEWLRYWRDVLRAEAPNVAVLDFTTP